MTRADIIQSTATSDIMWAVHVFLPIATMLSGFTAMKFLR